MEEINLLSSPTLCAPTRKWTVLLINGMFQAAVLFTFLTAFYAFYASKIEAKAANDQFSKIINENLGETLKQANKKSDGILKAGIDGIRGPLKQAANQYKKPNQANEIYNTWLFRSGLLVSGFLIIALIGVVLLLKFTCGHCPSSFLFGIVKSDVIIFAIIGVVEFMFFKYVALKLIPAPPSLMVNEIIQDIKTKIFGL